MYKENNVSAHVPHNFLRMLNIWQKFQVF